MATGQALVQAGFLDAEKLATLLQESNGDLLKFSDFALTRHGVGRNELAQAVGAACQVPVGDPSVGELDEEIATKVPEQICRDHKVIAIAESPEGLVLYAADPSPWRRQQVEAAAGGLRFAWRASDNKTVTSFIEQMFRTSSNLDEIVSTFAGEEIQRKEAEKKGGEVNLDDQSPVVQLVAKIVSQALRDRTSDIHIEPLDDRLRIRFRVDGHLVEAFSLPLSAHNALTSRLKIMSEMNIVEKRAPQDGQFSTKVDGKELDVRVASVATVFGEKIVMRLLDKSKSMVGLAELGMPKETYNTYSKLVHAPFGMVICAGPTGAGKTTTLYATLLEINSTGKNVTTVEDPVEYVFPGINQVQTNEKAGLTFATGLKALLRQDPDVILVGEIRDADTARIAIQSALTGHFVLSSLHGTDAVAALHRLLDMGIEAFLVASAIVGVVSQRLIRKMCDNCKEPYEPGAEELAVFRQHSGGSEKTQFFQGAGCSYCSGTGYRDRIGVYELLRITPEIRRLIVGWATTEELRRLAVAQGMRTMLREAMQLVEDDITTVPEVVRTLFAH
ncbi:type II secretion system protein E [Ilumatobacter coccineus YM16-304]|uniref:Type II secretion system protein E n=2 Tax=Ilumatobacter coccineus TaxID=467094 RepID=A0A6C7DUQ7_ILUCY|nr:type II secretion system protein E [Ilumatobacter coccineus YM16-304]